MSTEPDADSDDLTEELVRRALSDAALQAETPPWSAAAVRKRMDRARRRRRLAIAVPLVAAVAVATGLLLPGPNAPDTKAPPAASAPPRPRMSPSPAASNAAPLVVEPGTRIDIGHGVWMSLAPDQYCLDYGFNPSCHSVTGRHQRPGTLSLDLQRDRSYEFFMLIYVGPGKPARMIVHRGGSATGEEVQAVTLPGNPGFATAHFWGPPIPTGGHEQMKITVYDAQGRVLTSFDDSL